ncbi:MAG: hypothetical protein AB8H80_13465 [Planctomycetota bacterium]
MPDRPILRLSGCRAHNLCDIDVEIPHGLLTVVTGVSGSGKSSLVFDTLHAACERRYLETLSAHARRFLQRLPAPDVREATGLAPSIAVGQRQAAAHARSTVGTLSGLHDLLRFWAARENGLEPRELSFVGPGACGECRGLGELDQVDPELLVADASKTLRQGALVPTTPNGYIVYSQVTVDALDTVCRAHGFDVDTPWSELSEDHRRVVFYGSDRVEVPFGKHSIESRMRWQGITAKPRELGHYKGIVPTIADILRRSRNENALRFARSVVCKACSGSRLGAAARSATLAGARFVDLLAMSLAELGAFAAGKGHDDAARLRRRLDVALRLGLGHLTCARSVASLSGGEQQRLRLGTIATAGLSGVVFVFDEPSIGLHHCEERAVVELLLDLRDAGNTVVVVEHSDVLLRAADHLIDVGPGAGRSGGRVLFAGPPRDGLVSPSSYPESVTCRLHAAGAGAAKPLRALLPVDGCERLNVRGAYANNLRRIDVEFVRGRLNVVAGVAGAGKSTLVADVLKAALQAQVEQRRMPPGLAERVDGAWVEQVVHVDQAPIGRTPRSNPATYTGLFDVVRKRFATEPLAKERGYSASTFSSNSKAGGRCEACEGSGREVVGMHGLPPVELVCAACEGRRYRQDVLDVRMGGKHSIADVLDATVDEAVVFFASEPALLGWVLALQRVGLGHLQLGQPATTLSGGEAQRVRLAGELAQGARARAACGARVYILEEPTIGLHRADVVVLLQALEELVAAGSTVVLVEHDRDVLRAADHIVDLGPGAGPAGGELCGQGTPGHIATRKSATGRALTAGTDDGVHRAPPSVGRPPMRLFGVTTHNLRNVDLELPAYGLTVVTGVSGSGKSSLVFDTLYGVSRARMTEHLSAHVQRQLAGGGRARAGALRAADGLRPVLGLRQRTASGTVRDARSVVATVADLHAPLRTVWARLGARRDREGPEPLAGAFSFATRDGACEACRGAGVRRSCDASRLLADASLPLFDGALAANRVVQSYADPKARYRAILVAVAKELGGDLSQPFDQLPVATREALLHGCGDRTFDVVFEHVGAEGGAHEFVTVWPGIAGDMDLEYGRRLESGAKTRVADYEALLHDVVCESCGGARLREPARSTRVGEWTLPALCALDVDAFAIAIDANLNLTERDLSVAADTFGELRRRAQRLQDLGLGHLRLDRVAATLSGGERQRLELARQLAAPLHGCVYVLDEPTLGLHARDVDRLLGCLQELVAAGNSVVAVEHDARVMAAADHIVEVGPGAGEFGGNVTASCATADLPLESLTAQLLRRPAPTLRAEPRNAGANAGLQIEAADAHNLRGIDVAFFLGSINVVCGVSGSGKSTLLRDVLVASARAKQAVGCRRIAGLEAFAAVVDDADVRQRRDRRSCVATMLDVYGVLQKLFAATDDAKARGFRAARFAWLGKSAGVCSACGGLGRIASEFEFLGVDAWVVCDSCQGRRFDAETLAVRWRGMSLADVLQGDVAAASRRLREHQDGGGKPLQRAVREALVRLDAAEQLGLGYLRLGQPGDSLSGGEAQRVQLAMRLAQAKPEPTLFVLDEPSRGLHPQDVVHLLTALASLAERGHTIVAVEHDLDVIAAADRLVELGPGQGRAGGSIVGEGSAADLAALSGSATGAMLRGG